MTDTSATALVVVFSAPSPIEANVVRGLLDAQGIPAQVSGAAPRALSPLGVDAVGDVRVAVRAERAAAARRIIDAFRNDTGVEHARWEAATAALEARLGHVFRDKGLLEHALTHRSRAHEDASGGVVDNESLEFLGDAVLDLIIADRLYHDFPDYDEGRKSKAKALLVAAPSLARQGAALGLGECLLLGRGEERSGGRRKPSLIADTFEAVVAAVYLDGGLPAARRFIERQFRAALDDVRAGGVAEGAGDHKSALQEWLQGRGRGLPEYRVAASDGPDHAKTFTVEVLAGGDILATAVGASKKAAEQSAAAQALARLAGESSAALPPLSNAGQ